MPRVWFMDNTDADQRLPHRLSGAPDIAIEELRGIGVNYWKLDPTTCETDGSLAKLKDENGYNYTDVITVCPEKLPNYEDKIKMFFEEHLHSDDEIRFVMEGSGYFDVRDHQDRWIRIMVETGDMITLPAGIYHRFTLDTNNYIKAMRLFKGDPVWTPINRPDADSHPVRAQYVQTVA